MTFDSDEPIELLRIGEEKAPVVIFNLFITVPLIFKAIFSIV